MSVSCVLPPALLFLSVSAAASYTTPWMTTKQIRLRLIYCGIERAANVLTSRSVSCGHPVITAALLSACSIRCGRIFVWDSFLWVKPRHCRRLAHSDTLVVLGPRNTLCLFTLFTVRFSRCSAITSCYLRLPNLWSSLSQHAHHPARHHFNIHVESGSRSTAN